jgi:uncharacterized membrane protein
MSKGRLEAFSDGVLAIAVTLLALTLPTPPDGYGQSLAHWLSSHWPNYASYLASFLIIGIIWLNHHALIGAATVVTRPAVIINLGLLLCVVSIPYVTSLMAQYLRDGGWDANVAAALYCGVMCGMALAFAGLFEVLGRATLAVDPSRSYDAHVAARRRFTAGVVPYAICVGVAFASAYAALAVQFALAAYYLLDQLSTPSASVEEASPS